MPQPRRRAGLLAPALQPNWQYGSSAASAAGGSPHLVLECPQLLSFGGQLLLQLLNLLLTISLNMRLVIDCL